MALDTNTDVSEVLRTGEAQPEKQSSALFHGTVVCPLHFGQVPS